MERAINPDFWKATMAALVEYCGKTGRSPGEVMLEWTPGILRFAVEADKGIKEGDAELVCSHAPPFFRIPD